MNHTMLKSKIHRATVTECDLDYVPRVVHVTHDNEIRTIDNEVATLLGAPTA
jgi:aspartate 1-decarboxylase